MKKIIYQGRLEGDFVGFDDGMLFETANGQFWIQAVYKYWYHYAYRPEVVIYLENNRHYLSVGNEKIQVNRLTDVIKSSIDGEFTGWAGDSVYKLNNGQKWQQSVYKYEYKYAYSPDVVVYNDGTQMRMNVAGTSAKVKRVI